MALISRISGTRGSSPLGVVQARLAVGTTPATSGALGLPNNSGIYFRNAANSADITGLNIDATGEVILGDGFVTLYIMSAGSNQLRFDNTGNLMLLPGNASAGVGGGQGVLSMRNSPAAPSSNPTSGSLMYATAGAMTVRGSSGTITTIAPA